MSQVAPHCKYFVLRKKRYCRMLVKEGDEFCGEHLKPTEATSDVIDSNDKKIRIVCPLDRKHTCYAHNLQKHLKICNARIDKIEPYIVKDVNSGKTHSDNPDDSYKMLSLFSVKEIVDVAAKVNKVYEEYVLGKISEIATTHNVVEEEMTKPEYGDKTKKHLKQASAILGLLDKYNMLKENTCFIEFGAGRGQLSYWIRMANDGSRVLLVERASPKHKQDNKLVKSADEVQRIRADISDLVLDKVDIISKVGNIVGVTKHLCGGATDLAIRCLSNVVENKDKITGAVLTFCCHHRCRWTPYVGKQFFEDNGLTENDFNIMCGMASWATCGSGFSRERRNNEASEEEKNTFNERGNEIGLNRKEKEELGRRCKNVINWGRLVFLESSSFDCRLHYYVEANISLENVCIVAYKKDEK